MKVVWQAPHVRHGLLLDVSGVLPGSDRRAQSSPAWTGKQVYVLRNPELRPASRSDSDAVHQSCVVAGMPAAGVVE